ncbi:MAG TPA: hypothetical protein VIA10_01760 [Gaiellaceae bacterium]
MRRRLIAARILVVIGGLLAAVAAVAGYVRYQAFDDETFKGTAEELIADPVIRDEIAASLVDSLYSNVDVAARLQRRLPEEQQGLAVPLAAGFRALAESQAGKLLGRPRAQRLWVATASQAQQQVERVLDGDTTVLDTQDGWIVLNLEPLVIQLGERVAVFGRVADLLGEDRAVVRVFKTDDLKTAQDITSLFKFVALWLWVVPLLLWAVAVWLARGRRRELFRAVSLAIIGAGILVLLLRAVGGRYVVGAVADESGTETAEHAWAILTSLLVDGGRTLVGVGVLALAGSWLVGPSARATALRHRAGPYLQQPEYAFGAGAVALLLVVWWGPTVQTRRLGWIIVIAALLAVGIEVLRRVAAREEQAAVPAAPEPAT